MVFPKYLEGFGEEENFFLKQATISKRIFFKKWWGVWNSGAIQITNLKPATRPLCSRNRTPNATDIIDAWTKISLMAFQATTRSYERGPTITGQTERRPLESPNNDRVYDRPHVMEQASRTLLLKIIKRIRDAGQGRPNPCGASLHIPWEKKGNGAKVEKALPYCRRHGKTSFPSNL